MKMFVIEEKDSSQMDHMNEAITCCTELDNLQYFTLLVQIYSLASSCRTQNYWSALSFTISRHCSPKDKATEIGGWLSVLRYCYFKQI